MAKPTLDEIWKQTMGQAPGMPPVMIDPQVGSGSFDLNGPVNQTMGMIEQPQFGQIPQIQSAPQEPKKSFGKKALDFLGQATGISGLYGASKKAGEISQASDQLGLGIHEEVSRLIAEAKKFKTGDPKRKKLLQQAQEVAQAGGQGADALLGAIPKDRQVIGSAGKLALTVGSLGMGAPATVGGRLAAGTLTGGAFGGLDAAERGEGAGGVAGRTALGAVMGLGTAGALEAVRWAVKTLPERLMSSKLKEGSADTRKAIISQLTGKGGKETVGKEALDRGFSGSAKKIALRAYSELDDAETKLQTALKGSRGMITKSELQPYVDSIISNVEKTPGMGSRAAQAQAVFDELPGRMTLSAANEMKRRLYGVLDDISYRQDATLSVQRQAQKQLARGIKELIEKKVKSADVAALNKTLSSVGRIKDAAIDDLVRSGRLSVGTITLWHQLTRLFNTTYGMTKSAAMLNNLGNVLERLPDNSRNLVIQSMVQLAENAASQ